MLSRVGLGAIVMALAVLASAAPASAWWAGSSYARAERGFVHVHSALGEQHDMTIVGSPGTDGFEIGASAVVLRDASAPVTPAPDGTDEVCPQADEHTVVCPAPSGGGTLAPIVRVKVNFTGDADDTVAVPAASAPIHLDGDTGPGNDTVDAYDAGGASIVLGDGNDSLVLRGSLGSAVLGIQSIEGGAGDDRLDVVNGAMDNPYCGEGEDWLRADAGETNPDCEQEEHFP